MKFSNSIEFSNNLIEGQNVTVTYSGYLFENNSTMVKIVYGFGNSWMYTQEKQMEKTENGFTANIKMLNFDKLNFCFKNSNNEWDNNYGNNFIAPISELDIEEEFILNENVIENIMANLLKDDISEIKSTNNEKTNEKPVVSSEKNVSNSEDSSFEVHFEKNEAINIEDTIVNITDEYELNKDIENEFTEIYHVDDSASTKQALLDSILAESISSTSSNNESASEFNVNELINDILEPIVKAEEKSNSTNTLDTTSNGNKEINMFEESDDFFEPNDSENIQEIEEKDSDNEVDVVISDLINELYEKSKKLSTNLYENEDKKDSKIETTEINSDNSLNTEYNDFEINTEDSLLEENVSNNDGSIIDFETDLIKQAKVCKLGDEETSLIVSPRALSKVYSFKKKVKLAVYKFFTAIPRIIASNLNDEKE